MSTIFVERVSDTLKEKGMKQSDLCRATGLRSSHFTSWKQGSSPSLDNAAAIAKALDVSLDWLAGLTDDPHGEWVPDDPAAASLKATWDALNAERRGRLLADAGDLLVAQRAGFPASAQGVSA